MSAPTPRKRRRKPPATESGPPPGPWQGVVEEYRSWLDIPEDAQAVTLLEGGTPLLDAPTSDPPFAAIHALITEEVNAMGEPRGACTQSICHGNPETAAGDI
ncbi:MAG: hypothetical protein KY395_08515, partial [Actinobacteria bacterium]|nr:hypothetical protein [Actinomycetota bacterium]